MNMTHTYLHIDREGGDDDEEQTGDILDEPAHVRVRREKGMLLASASRPSRDAMEESSDGGDGSGSGDSEDDD